MTRRWNGEDNEEAHAAWCEVWEPRCPMGNPQRVATLVGYREGEPGRLQLRVLMRALTEGICDAIIEEDEDTVRVRVLLCWEDGAEHFRDRDYVNCPVYVYLDTPLNGRAVIAADDDDPLPLYAPRWEKELNGRLRRQSENGDPAA